MEVSSSPYRSSFAGIYVPPAEPHFEFGPAPTTSWSTTSSEDSLKIQKRPHNRVLDLEMEAGRKMYLQRRNSVSTQAALHPFGARHPSMQRQPSQISPRASSVPSTIIHYNVQHSLSSRTSSTASSDSLATTLRTTSSGSTLRTSYSSAAPSRTLSSVSSLSYSPSRKSPLSAMRRASQPDVPVIPDKFLNGKQELQVPPKLSLADTWSLGSLQHAPLSADPAIRAFSLGLSAEERSVPASPRTALSSHPTSDAGLFEHTLNICAHLGSASTASPPDVPARARGHVARQTRSEGNIRYRTSSPPSAAPNVSVPPVPQLSTHVRPIASTIQRPPRASITPAPLEVRTVRSSPTVPQTISTTNLHSLNPRQPFTTVSPVLRARTPTPPSRNTSFNNYAHPLSSPALGSGRGTIIHHQPSSASNALADHHRLRTRFEQARAREARDYGMGSWHAQPPNASRSSISPAPTLVPSLKSQRSQASFVTTTTTTAASMVPMLTKDKSTRKKKKSSRPKRKVPKIEEVGSVKDIVGGLRIVS